jgi:beta-lactam-binding protein with PASTA domain
VPSLVGLKQGEAEAFLAELGLRVARVEHLQPQQVKEPQRHERYGVGSVLQQEPAAGALLPRGGEVRLAVAAPPPQRDWPRSRPRPE